MFKNKQEAAVWAWMTDTARFRAHSFQTQFGMVHLQRGQLLVSQRTIGEDFGLGRQQVRRLLDSMKTADMIAENSTHSASRAGTIITIINYERYQSDKSVDDTTTTQGQPKDQPKTNPKPTQDQPTREEREKGEEREVESPSDSSICATPAGPSTMQLALLRPNPAPPPAHDVIGEALRLFELLRSEWKPDARPLRASDKRRIALGRRLSEIGGLPGWLDVLASIRGSPFLRGETSRNGFVTIDWLVEPKNLTKVMEGNYDEQRRDGRQSAGNISAGPLDAVAYALAAGGFK